MYYIVEVQQHSIVEYRIMRPGDGLVAYTYSDPIKAYLKLARLEYYSKEEWLRYINWKQFLSRLRRQPDAKYYINILPSI